MAMMSSDRFGGGYSTYSTRSVRYELSQLTKNVFDELAKGITGERLSQLLEPASESDLARFRMDIGVAREQESFRNRNEVLEILEFLNRTAEAELERRKPGPKLLSQLLSLLSAGTTMADIETLLVGATSEALGELPRHLDSLLSGVRADQPEKAAGIEEVFNMIQLMAAQVVGQRIGRKP
jgi:hypothetical protein